MAKKTMEMQTISKPSSKKKIMIVDDDPDIRMTVKTIMEKEGYDVVEAVDGDDCLEKLKTNKVDIVLLDIMMPGSPVSEVVKRIEGTKIIFVSVVRTSEAEKEGLMGKKNIVDFIHKPFNIEQLIASVKKNV